MKSALVASTLISRRIVVGLGALLLTACGGGGGGASAPAPATASIKYMLAGAVATPIPEGVVLDDGQGNTAAPAVGDTIFKFKDGQPYLSAGAPYTVSVKAQPKGYTCAVEGNTGTANANMSSNGVMTMALRCTGLATQATYVNYPGQRDGSFGFQRLALGKNGDYFLTVAFDLMRVDAAGKAHRLTLLDNSTGIPMPDLTVRSVVVASTGVVYLSVQRNTDESAILRMRQTATEDVYLVDTLAESFVDAANQSRKFGLSVAMSIDSADNLYVADRTYKQIRKITSAGVVSTLAGSGVAGSADGTGTAASFNIQEYILSMSHDSSGNLYLQDDPNKNAVRKITPAGVVTTVAVPVGYRNAQVDEAGNLYLVTLTSTGVPSIVRVTTAGATELLVSRGAVNLDSAPAYLKANAIGYIQAYHVAGGVIHVAGHNPMAIYKIKL